jgi:probable phosphoglycerate mutase
MDFGAWTGRSVRDLEADAQWRDFNERRNVAGVPGGENMLGLQARVMGGLLRLADEYPGESIAIVSHAEPIRAALLSALGIPLDRWQCVDVFVASISIIRFSEPQGFVVAQMNETQPQPLSTS